MLTAKLSNIHTDSWVNAFLNESVYYDLSGENTLVGRSMVVSSRDKNDKDGKLVKGSPLACCKIEQVNTPKNLTDHFD